MRESLLRHRKTLADEASFNRMFDRFERDLSELGKDMHRRRRDYFDECADEIDAKFRSADGWEDKADAYDELVELSRQLHARDFD
jgi:hypothetical protein